MADKIDNSHISEMFSILTKKLDKLEKSSIKLKNNNMIFCYNKNNIKTGIYEIRNTLTERSYIGQAKEFRERWVGGHRYHLIRNNSKNMFFQNDFNKCIRRFGYEIEELINLDKEILNKITNFLEFHIIQTMENSTKKERNDSEEYWIKYYKQNGYNLYNFNEKDTRVDYENYGAKSPLSKSYNVDLYNQKTGEIIYGPIVGLRQTARELNLYHRDLLDLITGDRKLCNDFVLLENKDYDYKKEIAKYSMKTYNIDLYDENTDTIYYGPIVNLTEFCKQHGNLLYSSMLSIINNKLISYKGWKLLKNKNINGKEEGYKKIRKFYDVKLISPDGKIYGPFNNLPAFAKEHFLNHHCLYSLINGKNKSLKGWKVYHE